MSKRLFDLIFASLGLVILIPLLFLMAAWIKFDSTGPIFFRQERVGQYGKTFRIHKFRTMVTDAEKRGLQITVGNDSRITRSGAFLRRYKLDELPQLIDVVIGKMSLVGPRPEVPKYVACYPENLREVVLSVKPGITDLASIEFKDENTLLGQSDNPEQTYKEIILPIKLGYYTQYATNHNILLDFMLIMRTLKAIAR
ncbi:sugar transferase [Thiothrix eikelboomii]|uniref:sugar transferase n=1 Tax=Thiothrix eikelboomii TaxID=92487 RepID=UPI003BB1FC94